MNAIGSHVSGLQHIGLPTNDMEKTLAFYEKLGFTVAFRTVNNGEKVCFLKLAGVCVETYENGQAVGKAGAIDHIALDVRDVERLYGEGCAAGYPITTDGIESLPFWEKGIRFFKTQGPDGESVEFCEILK